MEEQPRLRNLPARSAAAAEEGLPAPAHVPATRRGRGKKMRKCTKCGQEHYPPTGLKCTQPLPAAEDLPPPPPAPVREIPVRELPPPPPAQVRDAPKTAQPVAQDMTAVAELTQTLKGFMNVLSQQLPHLQAVAQAPAPATTQAQAQLPAVAQPPAPASAQAQAPANTTVLPVSVTPAPAPGAVLPVSVTPAPAPGPALAPVPPVTGHPAGARPRDPTRSVPPVTGPPSGDGRPREPARPDPSNTQYAPGLPPQPSNTQHAPAVAHPQAAASNTRYAPHHGHGDAAEDSSDSDAEDAPGLTARRMRDDRTLQHSVGYRMTELNYPPDQQPCSGAKGKKQTGKAKTAADVVEVDVDAFWPHLHVRAPGGEPISYESLTLPLFLQGYTQIMRDTKNKTLRSLMLNHLQDLAIDAATFPWEWVRDFHAAVLTDMERGKSTWLSHKRIQTIRHREIVMRSITQSQSQRSNLPTPSIPPLMQQPTTAPSSRSVAMATTDPSLTKHIPICASYQTGQCSNKFAHDGLKHICQFCWDNYGNQHKHAAAVCNKKNGRRFPKKGGSDKKSKN